MLKFIEVENTKVAYQEEGKGEPVVLLHGYPQNHYAWRAQIKKLASQYRVIALDWFGWGHSERNLNLNYSYENEVERLKQVLDTLEISSANIFGHDYGGFLSLGFCLKYPAKVKRLAILNSRAHGTFTDLWYIPFFLTEKIARVPFLANIIKTMPMAHLHEFILKRDGLADPVNLVFLKTYTDFMKENHGKKWLLKFFGDYTCKPRPGLFHNLEKINCPTAIIWGDDDPYIPISTAIELTERIPLAKLYKIKGGKHFVMETKPEEVSDALTDLLEMELKTTVSEPVTNLAVTENRPKDRYILLGSILLPLTLFFLLRRLFRRYQK